jgi:hypothetical protein
MNKNSELCNKQQHLHAQILKSHCPNNTFLLQCHYMLNFEKLNFEKLNFATQVERNERGLVSAGPRADQGPEFLLGGGGGFPGGGGGFLLKSPRGDQGRKLLIGGGDRGGGGGGGLIRSPLRHGWCVCALCHRPVNVEWGENTNSLSLSPPPFSLSLSLSLSLSYTQRRMHARALTHMHTHHHANSLLTHWCVELRRRLPSLLSASQTP